MPTRLERVNRMPWNEMSFSRETALRMNLGNLVLSERGQTQRPDIMQDFVSREPPGWANPR